MIVAEAQYFPPIPYFAAIKKYNGLILDAGENYQKSSYRNRCHIAGPNGLLRLSIPLERGKGQRKKITDVKISYGENWQKNHWKSLTSCYRSSPYFEFYEPYFETFFQEKCDHLIELNYRLTSLILKLLKIEVEPVLSTGNEEFTPSETVLDLRNKITPRKIELKFYNPPKYLQVFEEKTGFIPDLSILDILFNEGPNSLECIERSIKS